jgi:cytochrome c oxidase subunit 2
MQEIAWYSTVLLVVGLGAVFLFVASQAGHRADYDGVQLSAYRFRSQLFWGLVVLGIVVAAATLRHLPYVQASEPPPAQVVTAKGFQWYWELGRKTVSAGQPVEFQITSGDVNHGFGIYDSETRLLTQAQAMPGYVNRLQYTFAKPGKYRVMCLEYCGLAHHDMSAVLEVKGP